MSDINRFEALDALKAPFEQYLLEAQAVSVETPAQYELAASALKTLKGWEKDITDYFEPERKRTYEAYNAVTTTKKAYLDKAEKVERIIKGKMGVFQLTEQKRIAEERRVAEEAERQARAELPMPTAENPEVVSDIVVPEVSAQTKVAGVSVRKTWKYSIKSVKDIKDGFWNLNEALILKVVRDLGPDAEKVVGGIVVEEDVIIGATR